MKNKIGMNVLFIIILSGLFAFQSSALANNYVESEGRVKFKAPGPTDPVDPKDPEDIDPMPIQPTDPDEKNPPIYPGGPLRLNHIPTLSFGVNNITSKKATFLGKLETVYDLETNVATDKASFVEVADLTGDVAGWTVKVSSDGIFKSEKGNIEGFITLSDGKVRGLDGMDSKPEVAPTANQEVIFGKDYSSSEVMSADAGKGYNKWQVRYGHSESTTTKESDDGSVRNKSVALTILNGQLIYANELYVAKVVWTLEQGL